jgi:hypothetical protein
MLNEQEEKSLERADLIIEGNTVTWNMRLEGDIHGTYVGAFRFKCYLSPLQQIASNREYREILGPNPSFASEHESFLAYALTQLKYRIVSAPPFWASQNPASISGDIADENIISAVLDAALGSEIKYKSQLKKKKLEAIARAKAATEKLMKGDDSDVDEDEDEDDGESQDS